MIETVKPWDVGNFNGAKNTFFPPSHFFFLFICMCVVAVSKSVSQNSLFYFHFHNLFFFWAEYKRNRFKIRMPDKPQLFHIHTH